MPYVLRDGDGNVCALYQTAQPQAEEELPANHPDILRFLGSDDPTASALVDLAQSDMAMARVIEDLVEVLTLKGVITMDDLPTAAKEKLSKRQEWRGTLEEALAMFGGGKVI